MRFIYCCIHYTSVRRGALCHGPLRYKISVKLMKKLAKASWPLLQQYWPYPRQTSLYVTDPLREYSGKFTVYLVTKNKNCSSTTKFFNDYN